MCLFWTGNVISQVGLSALATKLFMTLLNSVFASTIHQFLTFTKAAAKFIQMKVMCFIVALILFFSL